MSDVAAWIAAGLYDPDAPAARPRLELLEHLESRGVTIDEMLRALATGSLAGAVGDKLVDTVPTLTRDEAAARVGMTPEQVDRAWLSVGLPALPHEGLACAESDLILLQAFKLGIELLGFDAALQFGRVLGSSLARVADAAITAFLVNVERPLNLDAARPVEIAKASEAGTTVLVSLPEIFGPVFIRHAAIANARSRATRDTPTSFAEYRLTVAFLDLVGYTTWSRELTVEQLSRAVSDFEEAASDRINAAGARVVKSIGDAIMFVGSEERAVVAVALELCRFVGRHPVLTELRGAVATGALLSRDGDYFGPTVNLAARAVKLAAPGEVIVDRVIDGFRSVPLGPVELRGIDDPPPLYRVS
jgi:class 3 adenylate cyclase